MKTAVEFLVEQIKQNVHNSFEEFELLVEQAQEMEKQQIIDFADWLDKLTPSQRVSVWSKDGEGKGLFTMDNEQLFEKYNQTFKSE
jgi:hypothetical protein